MLTQPTCSETKKGQHCEGKPLLSFVVNDRSWTEISPIGSSLAINNTLKSLDCEFVITIINEKQIGVEITEAKFGNVRKTIFDAIIVGHPSVWIEPKDVDHIFFIEHEPVVKFTEGALVCSSDDGFVFYSSPSLGGFSSDLKELDIFHDRLFSSEGKFVLFDESALHFVLIARNCSKWNTYARLGTGDIPEAFNKFKIYHTKITILQESDMLDETIRSDDISYYLRCIQDKYPLVRITPSILSMIKEGLEKLSISNSFSENALAMSVYASSISKILQSSQFSSEDQIITQMNASTTSTDFSGIGNQFIRSITSNYKNGTHEYQIHLPQLADGNRIFRKLGTDNFINVNVIGQVPTQIILNGKTYFSLGSSSNMVIERNVYFYDSSQYESVDSILSQVGESNDLNRFQQLCDISLHPCTETIKIEKWDCVTDVVSDGSGKISLTTAKLVCEMLGINVVPTAFEVQFLGFKGILTVLPDKELDGNQIILRKSMHQFESRPTFDKLEIVGLTNSRESGNLTSSMINTLIALGIQPTILQSLFEEWYNNIANNLTNSKYLFETLVSKCRDTLPSVQTLDELPDDPFIEDLLRHLVSSYLQKVQTKLIIPIEKSITCLSLIDEYNCLTSNEIMVMLGNNQYLEDGTKVMVCMEPCLHPSDVKIFTTRNVELLKQNYQTNHSSIVLSVESNVKCGRIFACWDSRLIPTTEFSQVGNQSVNKLPTLQTEELLSSIFDGWVAISEKEGALSARAIDLSNLYRNIRNGNHHEVPVWFNSIEYPDFMHRTGKLFTSNSVLSRIHHRLALMKNIIPKDVSIDLCNVKQGDAFEKINKIKDLIEYLKSIYNCTLFELVAGEGNEKRNFVRLLSSHLEEIPIKEYTNPHYDILSWIIPNFKKEVAKLEITNKLSNSVSRYLQKFRLDQLEKIESKLIGYKNNQQDDIYIVGSLSILLHDPNNTDCDWYIEPVPHPTFFDDLCHRLSTHFKPIKEEYHKSVPLFRMYLQDRDLNFLELIDLTNGDTGLRKKHHMRLYLTQQPKILAVLRILFDILKKICAFHIKTFQLTWEIIDFCIVRNYIHRESPPSRQEAVEQEKCQSDSAFMKSVLCKCMEHENFEQESELIIEFMKKFTLKNNMEFPDNLDDSKSFSGTSDERKIEYAHDLIQTCLVNLYLYKDFSKAILPSSIIQKTFEHFKNVDAKPVFRAETRDFVDGSVMTIFKGDSGDTPINFTFYKGHVHAQHAKLPIHRPSLENYSPECDIISPLYDQRLSNQLMKMEDKPENYVFIIRFGVYYLVNMQKSIFSEIPKPENSTVYTECMTKKAKVVKGPSADSFATGVNESVIHLLRPTDSPIRMTEYSVSFYKNVNNKSTEFKVRLDENMKLKTKVISGQLRVISHTFIGKNNDMRFYINHLQYLDINNDISELVEKLDKKGWLIKQGATDSELVFNKKLELIKTIRMEERETYTIHRDGEHMELDIVKVRTFNLPQNSRNQTLLFKEEHYEVEITLSNDKIHSTPSCLNLLRCGLNYWNQFIDK